MWEAVLMGTRVSSLKGFFFPLPGSALLLGVVSPVLSAELAGKYLFFFFLISFDETLSGLMAAFLKSSQQPVLERFPTSCENIQNCVT